MFESTTLKIRSSLAGDPDMQDLIEMYVDEIPAKLQALEVHLASQDWTQLQRLCHQIKGSAGGYGFECVTPVANEAEQLLQSDAIEFNSVQEATRRLIETMANLEA